MGISVLKEELKSDERGLVVDWSSSSEYTADDESVFKYGQWIQGIQVVSRYY